MKQSLFTLLFILSICSLSAQEVILKDAVSRSPIFLANVANYESQHLVTSDAKGRVDLTGFSATDSIEISLVGYQPRVIIVQEAIENAPLTIYLERSTFSLNEVVVSAAKWEQERRDVPSRIVSINPGDVQLYQPQTSADVLAANGNVFVQKSQLGGGSPMIRGFAANRVMLSVDGVRMNTAIFRSGNIQNVISIDPLALENTEVVYGPGSVIYGSDAIGGVVSFYTLEPKLSQDDELLVDGNAMLRAASANFEKTGHFDVSIAKRRIGLASSVTFSEFEDLVMGRNGSDDYLRPEYVAQYDGRDTVVQNSNGRKQIYTGYSQVNTSHKLVFQPKEHAKYSYGFHYSTTSDVPRYDRLTRYRGDTLRSAEWYYGPQEWMMHNLQVERSDRNWLYHRMRLTAAYQRFKESRHDRDFQSNFLTSRYERVDMYTLNMDLEQDIGQRHELFFGSEVVLNQVSSRAEERLRTDFDFSVPAPTRYPDGSVWNSYAVYVNDRFRLNEKLSFLAGARYNLVYSEASFDTTFYDFPVTSSENLMSAVNGSAGVVYRPNETWQFNVHLSTGFRAPNIDDIGKVFDSEPGSVVVPNPDLKPEYAYNGELSVTKVVGEFLKIDVTGFYTLLDNALVRRDFVLNGQDSINYDGELSRVQAIQNGAQATVYGVEGGFEAKLPYHFSWSTRVTYQSGEEELDDGTSAPLRHVPPAFGVSRISYNRNRLQLELNVRANAEVTNAQLAPSEQEKDFMYAVDANGNPYSPAWYTLNFRSRYLISDNITIMAGVENITDQRYRPYSSGISGPGRNFTGSVMLRF